MGWQKAACGFQINIREDIREKGLRSLTACMEQILHDGRDITEEERDGKLWGNRVSSKYP